MEDSSSSPQPTEEEKKHEESSGSAKLPKDDIEMTDEEEEEIRKLAEHQESQRRFLRSESDAAAFLLGAPDSQLNTDNSAEVIQEDLEQLIKASGGEDVEFEFYVAGEKVLPN